MTTCQLPHASGGQRRRKYSAGSRQPIGVQSEKVEVRVLNVPSNYKTLFNNIDFNYHPSAKQQTAAAPGHGSDCFTRTDLWRVPTLLGPSPAYRGSWQSVFRTPYSESAMHNISSGPVGYKPLRTYQLQHIDRHRLPVKCNAPWMHGGCSMSQVNLNPSNARGPLWTTILCSLLLRLEARCHTRDSANC